MDRSFLSRPEVIAASRPFVCVRLATYEDPVEARFLKQLVRTGSGELENSAFCLMGPDGKTRLSRPARGMDHVYADSAAMAADLKRLAARFTPKAPLGTLPLTADPRLGLDVAAADGLPLVVIVGKDAAARRPLVERMARLAWTDEVVGQFNYAEGSVREVVGVPGIKIEAGVVVIAPDRFGQKGTVLRQVDVRRADDLAGTLKAVAATYATPEKSFQTHVRDGHRLGIIWQTRVPVTDPMENAARERGRRQGGRR